MVTGRDECILCCCHRCCFRRRFTRESSPPRESTTCGDGNRSGILKFVTEVLIRGIFTYSYGKILDAAECARVLYLHTSTCCLPQYIYYQHPYCVRPFLSSFYIAQPTAVATFSCRRNSLRLDLLLGCPSMASKSSFSVHIKATPFQSLAPEAVPLIGALLMLPFKDGAVAATAEE